MFNGQSRQMCVRDQIGDRLTVSGHLLKNGPMSVGRPNHSCAGLVQPALYASNCLFERERVLKDPRIGSYSNECGQNSPAQTNNPCPGELGIPPDKSSFVTRAKRVFRVQEDVGFDEYQRESSPSIWAGNSCRLSIFPLVRRPIA